ncbi:MAG: hypothetical protein N2588_00390, partial [Rhodovarius sp.]|nr:hypothetical protein [Rhodovarius sp.]
DVYKRQLLGVAQTVTIAIRLPATHRECAVPVDLAAGLIRPDLPAPARRGLCTDGSLSGLALARNSARACQLIAPDYAAAERAVPGRARGESDDEGSSAPSWP